MNFNRKKKLNPPSVPYLSREPQENPGPVAATRETRSAAERSEHFVGHEGRTSPRDGARAAGFTTPTAAHWFGPGRLHPGLASIDS